MGYGTHLKWASSPTTNELEENVLQSTTIQYVPNDECKATGLWSLLEEDMMCGYGNGKRDSCSGDSGGPLFWERPGRVDDAAGGGGENSRIDADNGTRAEEEEVYQVGIVSWG
eukprot:CAMPEP_0201898038 /NCGR_PEP_ID=MMETSP0902-20130614/47765_1 /ASSEMBLY_ACC=CAM_ASM_000551 /TAXON_ID=420261 /ORGANISM="Thalassiosira antarctica, Strain CCMP982" /LENGTH=112 /DNA_ID=CAMNT_0048431073 /DNA_START=216 /DNA_END=551 /DNA_ORIENTATION=+